MIVIKSASEIEAMRQAGRIAKRALELAVSNVIEGKTTAFIDRVVNKYITDTGATPSFLGYNGYPSSICISVNDEVVHGIPSDNRVLKESDVVSIDVGAYYKGFHGDCADTVIIGNGSDNAKSLVAATKESFYKGLKYARHGYRIGDISNAIQSYIEGKGYSIVRDLVGHGIGRSLHEDPQVPNFGTAGKGPKLVAGMTLAIEPMVNEGIFEVKVSPNRWTYATADGKLSAHYENTVLITKDAPIILTDSV